MGVAEILAGFCVGWSETLVGYPFWTCKSIVQNRQTLANLSARRLYQGVGYPLISSVGFNTLVFPLHHQLHNKHDLPHFVSGMMCGVAVAPQMWFMDTFTIRRQTNQQVHANMFRRAKGLPMTMARESVALGAYFSTYHALRDGHNSFVSGAAAGISNWMLTFPLDTLRTRQIAQKCSVQAAWQQGHLWTGLHFALARAAVVNAVSFTVYENTLSMLDAPPAS